MKFERVIIKSDFDDSIYYLGYQYIVPRLSGKFIKHIACMIHVDDIEGMFGKDVKQIAESLDPGQHKLLPWPFLSKEQEP